MSKLQRLAVAGTVAVLAAGAFAVVQRVGGSRCEALADRQAWEAMTVACDEEYRSGRRPETAARSLLALSALRRWPEVEARLGWLEGTSYAPAAGYFRAKRARDERRDDLAGPLLTETIEACQRAGLHEYAAWAAHELINLHWTNGRFQAALAKLDILTEEARAASNLSLQALAEGHLADLFQEVGAVASQAAVLSSLAARNTDRPNMLAQIRLRQAMVEQDRANPILAADYLQSVLSLAEDAGSSKASRAAHLLLSSLARAGGDLAAAQAELDLAARYPTRHFYENTAWSFHQAQLLRDQGTCDGARAMALEALDGGALPDWQWQLLGLVGECAERQGDPGEARRAYREAVGVIERLQVEAPGSLRSGVMSQRRAPYEALFELSFQAEEWATALDAMEALHAGSFVEGMVASAPLTTTDLQQARVEGERRLAALEVARRSRLGPTGALGARLGELGERDAIGYVVARGTVYRLHARGGAAELARLGPAARLEELLRNLAAQPDALVPAEELGAWLWPSGRVAERVVVAADASLANLSFAGLRAHGRWLVEGHILSRLPSIGEALRLARSEAPSSDGRVRVLGDPRGDLPAAAAEAEALARALGVAPLLKGEVTARAVLDSCHAELLHFAGHSGLGLEGAWLGLADTELTAVQLLAARCAPRLVYLASCASASRRRSQVAATLAGAFLASGSRHVVATTHSVEDAPAAAFSRAFFGEPRELDPPERLARVQRRLLRSAPRSAWEPYVVLGW